ncbi:MAG: PilZ domain-containing protein [Sphingomonadales bacterium]|nr:PilZ domain-containing protein [Sphingomonadales bacterium]
MSCEERRQSPRSLLHKHIRFRTGLQVVPGVRLIELSTTGCRLLAECCFVQVDQRVIIKPEGFEEMTGFARWVKGDQIGVRFERPLHPSIFAHMIERFSRSGAHTGFAGTDLTHPAPINANQGRVACYVRSVA